MAEAVAGRAHRLLPDEGEQLAASGGEDFAGDDVDTRLDQVVDERARHLTDGTHASVRGPGGPVEEGIVGLADHLHVPDAAGQPQARVRGDHDPGPGERRPGDESQHVDDPRPGAGTHEHPRVLVRAGAGTRVVDVLRLVAGATLTGAGVVVSADPGLRLPGSIGHVQVVGESDDAFLDRAAGTADARVRAVGEVPGSLVDDLVEAGVDVITGEVLATGRRELLPFVREQAVSTTRHRFGHVAKG